MSKRKWLLVLGMTAIFVFLVFFALSGSNYQILKNLLSADHSNEEIRDQLMEFGWRGYIVITAFATLQLVCTILPAEPVQVLGGLTFGFPIGLACCMAGVFVGSTMIYLLQKSFGNQMREFFVKKLNLDMEKISRSSKSVFIIFLLYLLPAIPYGMICFLAASMGMRYRRYLPVMLLGALPSVCIGVVLGHIAIAVNWVVTVCIFAALLVVMIVLFCKKDALFTRLNHYADVHQQQPKTRVREANGLLIAVLFLGVRIFFFLCGVRLKAVNKAGRIEKPAIVLCNHGSFIDFFYAGALLRKYKPNFVGARLYFYHRYLGRLLRAVGVFPKSMFAMDMESVRNCFTVIRRKGVLAMMPEARLSTAGRFEDIQESTYSFIQKMGVSVYTVKINGGYLSDPKWGKGFRRGALVEAELDLLYTAEQVQSLPVEQLKEGIEQRLYFDEFKWLQERPQVHYRSRHIAEGLENILTTCPVCQGKYTLETKGNQISCRHCGELTRMDDRYQFTRGFRFENLAQWYDWQKALLAKEIAQDAAYALSDRVELRLPGDGKGLTRHGGYGQCTLNREGFTYEGTKDGEQVRLHFDLQRVYRLLFGAGENFEIYNGTEILYFIPQEKRSNVSWYMASMILCDEALS